MLTRNSWRRLSYYDAKLVRQNWIWLGGAGTSTDHSYYFGHLPGGHQTKEVESKVWPPVPTSILQRADIHVFRLWLEPYACMFTKRANRN